MADTGGTDEVTSGSPSGRLGCAGRAGAAAGSGEDVPPCDAGVTVDPQSELPTGEPWEGATRQDGCANAGEVDQAQIYSHRRNEYGCHHEGHWGDNCPADEAEPFLPPPLPAVPPPPELPPPSAPMMPAALPMRLSLPAATALASLYSPAPASSGRITDALPSDPLTPPAASPRAAYFRCKEEGGTAGCTGDSCTESVLVSTASPNDSAKETHGCAALTCQGQLPSLRCPVLVHPSGRSPAASPGASSSFIRAPAEATGGCILCSKCFSRVDSVDGAVGQIGALDGCSVPACAKAEASSGSVPASFTGFSPARRDGGTWPTGGALLDAAGDADHRRGHSAAAHSDTIEIIITEPLPSGARGAVNRAIADVVGHAVSSMASELMTIVDPGTMSRISDVGSSPGSSAEFGHAASAASDGLDAKKSNLADQGIAGEAMGCGVAEGAFAKDDAAGEFVEVSDKAIQQTPDHQSNAEESDGATATGAEPEVPSVAVNARRAARLLTGSSLRGTDSFCSTRRPDESLLQRSLAQDDPLVQESSATDTTSAPVLPLPLVHLAVAAGEQETASMAGPCNPPTPVSPTTSLSPRFRRKGNAATFSSALSPACATDCFGRRRVSTPSWKADTSPSSRSSPRASVIGIVSSLRLRRFDRSCSDIRAIPAPSYSTEQMRWQGNTPSILEDAVMMLSPSRIKELVDNGVSVNVPLANPAHGEHEPQFTTLLHKLVNMPGRGGAFENEAVKATLATLIQCQANLNPRSSNGQTPLIIACRHKNLEAVKMLLEHGASVSPIDDSGTDCLREAIKLGTQRQGRTRRSSISRPGPGGGAKSDGIGVGETKDSKESSSSAGDAAGCDPHKDVEPEAERTRCVSSASACDHTLASGDSFVTSAKQTSSFLDDTETVPKVRAMTMHSGITELVANLYLPGAVGASQDSETEPPSPQGRCGPGCEGCISAEIVRLLVPKKPTARTAERDGDFGDDAGKDENWNRNHWENAQALVERGLAAGEERQCPLFLAVTQLNHEAVTALTDRGMKPQYLHKAVTTGSLQTVQALLAAAADPLAINGEGETAIDVALRNREDASIIDALRRAMSMIAQTAHTNPARSSCRRGTRTSSAASDDRKRNRKMSSTIDRRSRKLSDEFEDVNYKEDERNGSALGRCCSATKTLVTDPVLYMLSELSQQCRNLYALHTAQAISFMLVMGALFLPDVWVLAKAHNDKSLDQMLVVLLVGFLIEVIMQTIGFRRAYVGTFFFAMDVVGAASLLLDMSEFRHLTGTSVGDTVVIMRAARAAKLGARAGRFTRLVKLLRFLPGIANDGNQRQTCTAHVLTRILVTKLSTGVSCLIIVLIVMLPFPAIFTYPQEDWSMLLWCKEIDNTIVETSNWEQVDQVIADCRESYFDKAYHPHSVWHRTSTGKELLWSSTTTLWPADERVVEHGSVLLAFDFALSRQHEASANVFMTIFAILLLVGFSLMLSSSVSTIAVQPLEAMLMQVRTIGSTIYRHVEQMQQTLNKDEKTKHDHNQTLAEAEESDMADETALLEQVVRKLAALGVLVMNKETKEDKLCLEYMGEEAKPAEEKVEKNQRMSTLAEDTKDVGVDTLPIRLGSVSVLSLCSWDYNILALDRPHVNTVCQAMLSSALAKTGSACSSEVLGRFVDTAEAGYLPGPEYHNWLHAADVTHVLFVMLRRCCGRQGVLLGWLEECALLVAAVCHDIGHVGFNNDFLVATQHEYAMRYNDTSVLENMHCARLFEILMDPRTAIFEGFSQEDFKEVRSVCINAILHTDNVHHAAVVKQLQVFCEVHSELLEQSWGRCSDISSGSKLLNTTKSMGGGSRQWPPHELIAAFWEPDSRAVLRCSLLHFADISNPMRPFGICREWSICVLEEFFAQGELEKEKKLPVGPLNDRQKTNHPFSQIAFIEFFIAPMAFSMVRIMVPLEDLLDALMTNINKWAEEWVFVYGHQHSDDEIFNVSNRIKRLQERRAQVGANPDKKNCRKRGTRSRIPSSDF